MDLPPPVSALASRQDGVVSRRQLRGLGYSDGDIRSWRAHRLLTRVEEGVYVDHTGSLDPLQRDRAALLLHAPAVLAGHSALAADGLRRSLPRDARVHLAIDARRAVVPPGWISVSRVKELDSRARWHLDPPRDRLEDAVLDVASAASDELGAIAVLAEAVSSRRTTAARLSAALAERSRIARRRLIADVLRDLTTGACSVLEREYLRSVERAHRLPAGSRQVRASSRGAIFRDVEYAAFGVVVELDGRTDHTSVADRDRDLDRDLDAAVDGRVTVRLGWGQVFARACRTTTRISALLTRRGWAGAATACPRCPAAQR